LVFEEERPPEGGLSVSTVVIRALEKSDAGQTSSRGCSTADTDTTGPNDRPDISLDIGSPPFSLLHLN